MEVCAMDSYKKIWSRVIECGSIYAAIQAGSSFVEWWHGLLEGSFMHSLKSLWSLANWKTSLTLQLWWHSSKKLVQKLNIGNTDTNSIQFISIQMLVTVGRKNSLQQEETYGRMRLGEGQPSAVTYGDDRRRTEQKTRCRREPEINNM